MSSLVIVQDSSAVRQAQQVEQTAVGWQRNLSDYPCDILVPHIDSRVKLLITKGREQVPVLEVI